ncbi:NADH-quinone oxidoreductase subunit H, partial [uncultured Phenylobacterium sp.]|uniref:complex I subunit 1/NuoH family protein n=1 Tax=uncultured Phenylobacterium sp. TaxID=349273 RepID=UPI0025CF7676
SNSKYPFLGALRSAAQMVSYEVSIGFVIITVILLAGSLNLNDITTAQAGGFWHWFMFGGGPDWPTNLPLILIMFPMGVIFFISGLAETNRPPFDLPEAESELVAGYAVEYGSTPYMLFYLAETSNIVLMSGLMAVLFLGGWHAPWPEPYLANWHPVLVSLHGLFFYAAKTFFVFFMNAMVRSVVPRYRYDQLMRLGWKVFLPTSLVAVAVVAGWRVYTGFGA